MIESEQDREFILGLLKTWSKNTKIKMFLRDGDLDGLTNSILDRFYHISLCCGHKVKDFEEGIALEFYTYDDHSKGTAQGTYCKDCAGKYIKDLGAWEIK